MNIYDYKNQRDLAMERDAKSIAEAWKKYDNESPCRDCGPGNGCDDCRDCQENKINHRNYEIASNLEREFKSKYNISYNDYKNSKNKSKLMTADEARELLKLAQEQDNKEVEEILNKLHKAITERTENYVYITLPIKDYTIKKLELLGYKVGNIEGGDRFEPLTRKISF